MESNASAPIQTVAGLFDDEIDAGHALSALRKAAGESASISVLARDRALDDADAAGAVDVTKAVVDTAFAALGNWLSGLAALMVPQRGSFLAAGPIGIALANAPIGNAGSNEASIAASARQQFSGSLASALERFGFRQEAAHYIEERLAAGSAMIAVTASDPTRIDGTLQTFADFSAVFIGQAETPPAVMVEVERWSSRPLATKSSEIVVADVAVPLGRVCADPERFPDLRDWCGLEIVDRHGERAGEIDELLTDPTNAARLRYVVVGSGGVLGIARRRVAVPAPFVAGAEDAVRVLVDREQLASAPAYNAALPFSRRDEQALHDVFGIAPYWERE